MQIMINGNRMEAKEGQTVLQAALANGVYIPHLCYHEKVGAAGKCRACVVEIDGMRGLQTSCSVLAKEGMVVNTQTETALQAQRLVIDLMLSTGKHDCLACEQNGHCELQDAAYFLGIERPSILYADIDREIDTTSEFVHVDRNKCISCGRCVAACNGTVVNQVIDFGMRGHSTEIVFNTNKKMADSTCVQCGECSQICPVGALIIRIPSAREGYGNWTRFPRSALTAASAVSWNFMLTAKPTRLSSSKGPRTAPPMTACSASRGATATISSAIRTG